MLYLIDLLHACFSSIDCTKRVGKFKFSNEPAFELNGVTQSLVFESFCV